MKKITLKLIALVITVVTIISLVIVPSSAAESAESIKAQIDKLEQQIKDKQNEINNIKNDKKNQQKIKDAYDQQMALLQEQINLCNSKIRESNQKIADNEAEILKKEAEMAGVILEFKKRISVIYMSGSTESGIELLLGAEDFSDFLAMSQLTFNISKRDRKMMKDITDMIAEINKRKEENNKLIAEQNEIKATLNEKYASFDKLADNVQKEINRLAGDEKDANADKKALQNDLKAKEDYLDAILNPSTDKVYKGTFDGTFTWPVPGYLGMTSKYGERWGTMHKGIDIASSGIRGKPVIASAAGVISSTYTSCPHNYGKSSSCYSGGKRCGGGYGNNVVISHGKSGSTYYQSLYGHLGSVTVAPGQYVKQGQIIGYVGSTGYSTGWHLHFEIHKSTNGGKTYNHTNPENYVKNTK